MTGLQLTQGEPFEHVLPTIELRGLIRNAHAYLVEDAGPFLGMLGVDMGAGLNELAFDGIADYGSGDSVLLEGTMRFDEVREKWVPAVHLDGPYAITRVGDEDNDPILARAFGSPPSADNSASWEINLPSPNVAQGANGKWYVPSIGATAIAIGANWTLDTEIGKLTGTAIPAGQYSVTIEAALTRSAGTSLVKVAPDLNGDISGTDDELDPAAASGSPGTSIAITDTRVVTLSPGEELRPAFLVPPASTTQIRARVAISGTTPYYRSAASVAPEWQLEMAPYGGIGQSLNDLVFEGLSDWAIGDIVFMVSTTTYPVTLDAKRDGLYQVTHLGDGTHRPTFTRHPDYDTGAELDAMPKVYIQSGSFAGFEMEITTTPITIDVTALDTDTNGAGVAETLELDSLVVTVTQGVAAASEHTGSLFEVLEGDQFAGTFWKNLTLISSYRVNVSPFVLEQLHLPET